MNGWKQVKLGDICCYVCSGGTPKSNVEEYYDGDIPWLNTKEVDFNRIYETERSISQLGFDNSSAKWVEPNTIVVAMYGATAGKIGIIKNRMTTNQACCNLSINPMLADYNYVYYFLKTKYDYMLSLANGGAQQNLNAGIIKQLEIPLPELETQKRIARILSSLDDKIEVNNQISLNLEEQAKAIFKSWFVDFEQFGGEPPDDWKDGTIADLGKVTGGGTPSKAKEEYYSQNGIPWITPKDLSINKSKFISRGQIDISDAGLSNSSAIVMPKGTVLFSSRAPIGYIAIAKNEVTTNQGFKSVVPHPHVGTPFVYMFLKHNLEKIESVASGSTFKEVSGGVMKSIPALIPDNNSLSKFTAQCQPLFQKQEALEAENNILQETRDTLLPKLISNMINIQP